MCRQIFWSLSWHFASNILLTLYKYRIFLLPYVTLPFDGGILPPSTEASNRPIAYPQINQTKQKYPTEYSFRFTPQIGIPYFIPYMGIFPHN